MALRIKVFDHSGAELSDEAAIPLLAVVLERAEQPRMSTGGSTPFSVWASNTRFSLCIEKEGS